MEVLGQALAHEKLGVRVRVRLRVRVRVRVRVGRTLPPTVSGQVHT